MRRQSGQGGENRRAQLDVEGDGETAAPSHQDRGSASPVGRAEAHPGPPFLPSAGPAWPAPSHPLRRGSAGVCPGPFSPCSPPAHIPPSHTASCTLGKDQTCHDATQQTIVPVSSPLTTYAAARLLLVSPLESMACGYFPSPTQNGPRGHLHFSLCVLESDASPPHSPSAPPPTRSSFLGTRHTEGRFTGPVGTKNNLPCPGTLLFTCSGLPSKFPEG